MKKLISLIAATCILCAMLTGCKTEVIKIGGDEGVASINSNASINKNDNKTLTMWSMYSNEYVSDEITFNKAITDFKEDFPDVEFIIEKFEVPLGIDGGISFYKKIAAACMAGEGPDFIYANPQFMVTKDIFKMQAAGAFADITEFIENDKEFNMDNYNKVIFDGVKIDGKQCIIPLTYLMPIIYSPKETFEKEGFNRANFNNAEGILNEFIDFRERNADNDKMLFTSGLFFSHFYEYMGLNIVDHDNQKANLNDELFQKTLDFWESNYKFESFDVAGHFSGGTVLEYFPNKNAVLGSNVISYDDYFSTLRNSTVIADDAVMLPWRDTNGGIPVQLASSIMINNSSQNKQNAWEFIKRALSTQEQAKSQTGYEDTVVIDGIPVNKKAWTSHFEKWTGELYSPDERLDKAKSLTQKDFEYFVDLQNQISRVYLRFPNDREVYNMFVPYFEGTASYDKCKNDVQTRLDLYLTE